MVNSEQQRSEIVMPTADPHDPYALPAAMPSSADKSVKSFNLEDFTVPTSSDDDWRFTPIDRFTTFFAPFVASEDTQIEVCKIDGSSLDPQAVSVLVSSKEDTAVQAGRVGKPSDLASAVAWNCASRAVAIEVHESLDQPLLVRLQGTSLQPDAVHLCLRVDAKVHADIVIEHTGHVVLAEGVEIETGEFSQVSTTFIHEWEDDVKHAGNHRIRVGNEAVLRHCVATLGGKAVRIRMDQEFNGPQGDLLMLGMYCVDPGEHIEHRTMVVHNHPQCRSRVVYKGSLNGKQAHSTWVGNALIQANAYGTDSYELNKNLVLTPGAIADSEPNLEIENGDIVGAGHASSVGRFDDEELFYLQSRGISEREARKLVVRGFFAELIEEIGIPAISQHLMDVINRRLEQSES